MMPNAQNSQVMVRIGVPQIRIFPPETKKTPLEGGCAENANEAVACAVSNIENTHISALIT